MMKDIIFKVKQQKKELIIFFTCFLFALFLNIYSIIAYQTHWNELYSQWQIVILLSFAIYLLVLLIRLFFLGIKAIYIVFAKRK
jgi:F0F1-type ATP synthase membrane subunit a